MYIQNNPLSYPKIYGSLEEKKGPENQKIGARVKMTGPVFQEQTTPSEIMLNCLKYRNRIFLTKRFKTLSADKKSQRLKKEKEYDLIGLPNPITNLCPIKFSVKENETELEKYLRLKREELQSWNQEFWTNHNMKFIQEKEEYVRNMLKKRNDSSDMLSPDEMSVFYKDFLDKNWRNHFYYNIKWYKKNFYVTALDFRVRLQRFLKI